MNKALPRMKIFNLGFSTQPYSPVYLDMLEHALTDSPQRSVLMVITPISLVPRVGDDEAATARDMVGQDSRLMRKVDGLRNHFYSGNRWELRFGLWDKDRYWWNYPDGWGPESLTGAASPTEGVASMSDFMKRWAGILHYDPASYAHVLDRVRAWHAKGIHVY